MGAAYTGCYMNAARALGIPCLPDCPKTHTIRMMLGGKQWIFSSGYTPFNDAAVAEYAVQKYFANRALAKAGLPVPEAMCLTKHDYEQHGVHLHGFTFPVVIKPNRNILGGGRGVVCNIQNQEVLVAALDELFEATDTVVIEAFHRGYRAYRVLVFFGRVIGVVERMPAHIVGDGLSTIESLIQQTNVIRKGLAKKVALGPIAIDRELHIKLSEAGLALTSVPAKGEIVPLCYGCNSTRGGTMKSLGRAICQENAHLICSAATALNLKIIGFDLLCEDIMLPIQQTGGIIVEANPNPDISIHENPLAGQPVSVSKTIVSKLIQQHPVRYRLYRTRVEKHSHRRINFKKVFIIVALVYILPHTHFFNGFLHTKPEHRNKSHVANIVQEQNSPR